MYYAMLDHHHNPEPYIEIRLKQVVSLLQPYSTNQQSIAYDMKGSERYTARDRPVDLYQVGSYGSCLSALRSVLFCWPRHPVLSGVQRRSQYRTEDRKISIPMQKPSRYQLKELPLQNAIAAEIMT